MDYKPVKPVARHFEYITPFILTSTHRCPRFKPACLVILVYVCSSNYYLLNMMSVTKNSIQNQLQQVEMWLHRVYFHRTVQPTWSTAHVYGIILWTLKTLAYTTGTTSKHQRATWPELYPKSIVFLCIVAWHMRVFSQLTNVWGYGEGMLRCYQKRWKNAFLPRILKLPHYQMWRPRNPYVTCISCMLTWPDFIAYQD